MCFLPGCPAGADVCLDVTATSDRRLGVYLHVGQKHEVSVQGELLAVRPGS